MAYPDLTAPLAPGWGRGTGSEVSSPLGAREPKGLRRRLRPLRPGFRVCSTTALALRAPGKPGSLSISRNWSGVKLHLPAQRKAPDWVPFFVLELTSHQLGIFASGIRFFRFYYVQCKQTWSNFLSYRIAILPRDFLLNLSSCHIDCKRSGKMKYCIRRASILFGLQLYLNRMMESV